MYVMYKFYVQFIHDCHRGTFFCVCFAGGSGSNLSQNRFMSLKQVLSVPLPSVQQMTLKTDAPCGSWYGTLENRHLMDMTAKNKSKFHRQC